MFLEKYIFNDNEKAKMLVARQKSKELEFFYNNIYKYTEESYNLYLKTLEEQKENFRELQDNNPDCFNEKVLEILEDCLEHFVHAFFKTFKIKTTKTVADYFIRLFKTQFFVRFGNSYMDKTKEILEKA